MRPYALNSHIEPVRTEITTMQQITISQVCSLYKIKSKGIIAEEKVSQVCSTDKSESERFIVNGSSMG